MGPIWAWHHSQGGIHIRPGISDRLLRKSP
jgi:hypothetical protein